jgi:hypothetical protein
MVRIRTMDTLRLAKGIGAYVAAATVGVVAWWLIGRSVSGVTGMCTLRRPQVALWLGSLSGLYGMYLARHP